MAGCCLVLLAAKVSRMPACLQDDPNVMTWEHFDVSKIALLTKAPLQVVSLVTMRKLGLCNEFSLSETKMLCFLDIIESLYPRYTTLYLLENLPFRQSDVFVYEPHWVL
jgi:hypothetical protein